MIKRLIKYSLGIICFLGMSAILNQQVFADSDILNSNYVDIFSKNNILFYDPCSSGVSNSSSVTASGDLQAILSAKNADKQYTDFPGAAAWNDVDTASMKYLLESYGDLAYRLGEAIGAPYVAILVQMRYEDPHSECGANNFWGNGCPPGTSKGNASIQGSNLGEGFVQYGQTLMNICSVVGAGSECQENLKTSDPKTYLERVGPLWVQGDVNGSGYSTISAMKASVDALQSYIDSSEGQAIVSEFGGGSSSSSSSSPSSNSNSNSSSGSTGGSCDFTKYNYSDDQLAKLAGIAASENGGSIDALKFEMSLMANLFESGRGQGYSDVLDYVLRGGWFGSAKGSVPAATDSEQIEAARDVFNNGNRTIPPEIDEHDCIDCGSYGFDIEKIEVNGQTFSDPSDKLNMSNYISGETIIHNKYGSTYTFYSWPDGQKSKSGQWDYQDPFGATSGSWSCDPNGSGGGGEADSCCLADSQNASGDVASLQARVKEYVWPTYDAGKTDKKPEYAAVIEKRKSEGKFVGDSCYGGGVDCGGFVTTVIQESGWDPNYGGDSNCGTDCQYSWLMDSANGWSDVTSNISSNADMQPGDVLITRGKGHTFLYAGEIEGIDSPFVSASQCARAPMASSVSDVGAPLASDYAIFRKTSATYTRSEVATKTNSASTSGGMTTEKAQEMVDDYNANYNSTADLSSVAAGPANCFGLSVWFLHKYTDLDYHVYAENGRAADFVHQLATKQNVPHGSEPQVFSIFSTDNPAHSRSTACNGLCGHTGVVVGIDGDTVTVIEAGAGFGGGVVSQWDKSDFTNSMYPGYEFAYINDYVNDELSQFMTGINKSDNCASTSGGNGDLNSTALLLAWSQEEYAALPDKGQDKKEYQEAWKAVNGPDTWAIADCNANGGGPYGSNCIPHLQETGNYCGEYVATVVKYSGVDPDYASGGDTIGTAKEYLFSHPEKWEHLDPGEKLQGGEIAIKIGHAMISVKLPDGSIHKAEASFSANWAPHVADEITTAESFSNINGGGFDVFRYKG